MKKKIGVWVVRRQVRNSWIKNSSKKYLDNKTFVLYNITMIETKKIIQAVSYLLNKKAKALDKLKIVKLLYLADKYHLLKYGKTVTEDDYYAMQNGPVGSTVLNVLSYDKLNLSETEYNYAKSLFDETSKNSFISKEQKVKYLMLSETDKDALDFVINNYGKMNTWDLVKFTHKYPEWKCYEELLRGGKSRREKINIEDLVSVIPEDGYNFSKEHIKETKEIIRTRKC
ncbi:MAG: Panacea domain-containing protein [Elusimicrobia bacterium]|nr:Panacea domain-containing protein [Elusimicrobiota bacterium]